MQKTSQSKNIGRRDFLTISAGALAGMAAGCATNPVTGRKQLMLISEAGEMDVDRQHAPHQFSADYGVTQDKQLSQYLQETTLALAAQSHRPHMPYACHGVNAVYINGYTFPGGTMALTRGILLAMQSESELAAVLGHEIGHVCARHTARNMTRSMGAGLVIASIAAFVQHHSEEYADLAAGLGMVAGGAFLARYSRADERQADELGLEYMVKAGHNPNGFIALMDTLRRISRGRPGLLETMFATHPMSEERYRTAVQTVNSKYQAERSRSENRERYMDNIASIRARAEAIQLMQNGNTALNADKPDQAAPLLESARRQMPDDYTALLLLAKCRLMQKRPEEAQRLAEEARQIYPGEAQARHIAGLACMANRRFAEALDNFAQYEKLLPGNPMNPFFQGLALENMNRKPEAARRYQQFLQQVQQGEQARHAYQRLQEWGYI